MNLDSIGVYRISSPNGSVYIGMTAKSFKERWEGHRAAFRKGQMTCTGLRRAFEKYGVDAMSFEILEEMDGCSDAEILHREREWWLLHKAQGVNLYNGEPSGRGAVRHTEETRERIGAAMLGKIPKNRKYPYGDIECEFCRAKFRGPLNRGIKFCSNLCKKNGSKTSRVSREMLIAAVLQGGNSYAIAESLGIKKSSLYGLLHKYGLTIKSLQKGTRE